MSPSKTREDLPENVRHVLPEHAQEIYRKAFNNAWEEYADPQARDDTRESREEVAHKVAWAAVKHKYIKGKNGQWQEK